MSADILLQSALTLREAEPRVTELPSTFASIDEAIATWIDVALHEAGASLAEPLPSRPTCPYLHPVDVDTERPGIVNDRDRGTICRVDAASVKRLAYRIRNDEIACPMHEGDVLKPIALSERAANTRAMGSVKRHIARCEKRAITEERARTRAEARKHESPSSREARLREQRERRDERRRVKESESSASLHAVGTDAPSPQTSASRATNPPAKTKRIAHVEASLEQDSSSRTLNKRLTKARSRGKEQFFTHPLPHHRCLEGLHACNPNPLLHSTLLECRTSENVALIQGPPGTGKTTALVSRMATVPGRIFACAPTNVGAANLYTRCLAAGLENECALVMIPERIPPGVAVRNNDAKRRIVCGTISSRCGPHLNDQQFDAIFVDEAAQCTEASIWTLLRSCVETLVLAGDVQQLPATVSDNGRKLKHDRSLMERLMDADYDNVTTLTIQNRMAPELLAFPNRVIYGNSLVCGPYAPEAGAIHVYETDGCEMQDDTSWFNLSEVDALIDLIHSKHENIPDDAVILCPYTAQCHKILARSPGREVHTIDSFQGRETDVVLLTLVRDGERGIGFWSDLRRVGVAMTRARRRLIVIASHVDRWPDPVGDWLRSQRHGNVRTTETK